MAIEQVDEYVWVASPGFMDAHTHPRVFDVLTEDNYLPENNGHEGKAGLRHYTEVALRSGFTAMAAMGNESLRLPDPSGPEPTITEPYPISNRDRALAMASRICGEAVIPTGINAVLDPAEILTGADKSELDKDKAYARLLEMEPYTLATKVFLNAKSTGGYDVPVNLGAAIAALAYDVNPGKPVIFHVEGPNVGRLLKDILAMPNGREFPIDIAHISSRPELEAAIYGKRQGMNVQIEMTPHHGMLTSDADRVVKPALKRERDIAFLWRNARSIDRFGSDNAPHRLSDKINGVPGLANHSFMLPFLAAMAQQRRGGLTMEDVYQKLSVNPRRRFNLPDDDSQVIFDASGGLRDPEFYDEHSQVNYEQNPLTNLPGYEQRAARLVGRVVRASAGLSHYDETEGENMRPSYGNLLVA